MTSVISHSMAWTNERLKFSSADNVGLKTFWKMLAFENGKETFRNNDMPEYLTTQDMPNNMSLLKFFAIRNPVPLRYIKGCLIIYALIPIEYVRESIMDGLLYETFSRLTFQLLCIYFFIVIDSLSEKFFRENEIPIVYCTANEPEPV